jgi:hypothetical protein
MFAARNVKGQPWMDSVSLVRFSTVRQVTGMKPYALTRRLQRTGIHYFVDGLDKRQRSIDVRDLPRLIEPEPVKRRGDSAA